MRSPITTRATVPPSTHAAVQDNMAAVSFDCPSKSRSALLMVRPGLATDGCRAQYRLSPLLAQTILWWNTVLGYRLWCFAPLVGFADSAAAQPRLLRSLVSFADWCVLTGSTPQDPKGGQHLFINWLFRKTVGARVAPLVMW